jgi:hypothetical protein
MPQLTFEFLVEGLMLFTVACIGLLGNTIALLIFAKKKYHIFYRWGRVRHFLLIFLLSG